MNESIQALQDAAQAGSVMAVYRDETGDSWSGIPVATGPAIAVLARERDFVLDGYIAIGASQITGVEQYDDNDFIRRAMKGEGVYDGCKRPAALQTKDTAVIPYEDLCTITFGDNYLKVYAKYIKKQ